MRTIKVRSGSHLEELSLSKECASYRVRFTPEEQTSSGDAGSAGLGQKPTLAQTRLVRWSPANSTSPQCFKFDRGLAICRQPYHFIDSLPKCEISRETIGDTSWALQSSDR